MDCSINGYFSSAVNLDDNLSTNTSNSSLLNVILLETCNYSKYILNVLRKLCGTLLSAGRLIVTLKC